MDATAGARALKVLLIVEDQLLLAIGLKDELEEAGYRVLELAVRNQEAIDLALEVKPELIVPLLREAIQGIAGGNVPASLALNPKDAELVREMMAEHLQHGAVRILEDKSLGRGGCRLHSAGSTIDASVETRWKRVVEAIGADRAWLP